MFQKVLDTNYARAYPRKEIYRIILVGKAAPTLTLMRVI